MKRITFLVASMLLMGILPAWADLVVNGNFSAGNTGFATDYSMVPANGTTSTQPGQYGLTTNPATGFTNGYTSYTDHTGDAAGLMLLVDGGATTLDAWREVINVNPNTSYQFEAWVASADQFNLATLGLFVDGTQLGSVFDAPATPGVWTSWGGTVLTGPGVTQITLSIRDLNPNPQTAGNDFSLDDISLSSPNSPVPEPSSIVLLVSGLAGVIAKRSRMGLR